MEMICVQYSPKIYVDGASQRGIVKVGLEPRMGWCESVKLSNCNVPLEDKTSHYEQLTALSG